MLVQSSMGSFDSERISLREILTPLRMTAIVWDDSIELIITDRGVLLPDGQGCRSFGLLCHIQQDAYTRQRNE